MLHNAASDQGLTCLLTECSIKIWIKRKNTRLGVNYFEKVINYIQLHWKLFN